jgi:hypothetical protein
LGCGFGGGKIGDREIVKEGLEVELGTKMMMYL